MKCLRPLPPAQFLEVHSVEKNLLKFLIEMNNRLNEVQCFIDDSPLLCQNNMKWK